MLYIILSVILSVGAFVMTYRSIPRFAPLLMKAGLSGKDLSKMKKNVVPESLGLVCGAVCLAVLYSNLAIRFGYFVKITEGKAESSSNFPHSYFSEYLTAILCICCMLFLGFVDDVLNLKWRYKLILPTLASMPLLIVYYINGGGTHVLIPEFLHSSFRTGSTINIGKLYYIYMSLLAVFCTNSINIYAGINGLESGQSIIISLSIFIFNLIELLAQNSEIHSFSISIMLPFAACSIALFIYNKYPARVFVGDTYTYFAGMTFAVVGIIGHFTKTLLLFFIPQVFNFLYSAPQIFRIIPCPRHRIPKYDPKTDLMSASMVKFKKNDVHYILYQILLILNKMKIVQLNDIPNSEGFVTINNLTLLNLVLLWTGPLNEGTLTYLLLCIQILCTCLAFTIRYPLARYIYSS